MKDFTLKNEIHSEVQKYALNTYQKKVKRVTMITFSKQLKLSKKHMERNQKLNLYD